MPPSIVESRLFRIVSHFFPAWIGWLLVSFQWTVRLVARISDSDPAGADIVFATFAFWVWALMTNAHGHFLAHSSAHQKGTAAERKVEMPLILLLMLLTAILYMLCFVPGLQNWSLVAGLGAALIPAFFLGYGYE